MRVTLVTPGTGEHFYCENCRRDLDMARALRAAGHDTALVPLYLPIGAAPDRPVFYGAVNVYLEQVLPGYRRLPRLLRRWLDAMPVLTWAAAKAGSTRAGGLEAMTVSVLRGEDGRQADELARLSEWLAQEGRHDIIHISNALLAGLAGKLKHDIGSPVVCSLQDEDTWVDAMPATWRDQVWREMAERCRDVDMFVAVSDIYGDRMRSRLGIEADRIRVVYPGVDCAKREQGMPADPPVIGYFARLTRALGFDLFVDAFIALRKRAGMGDLRMVAAGGMTADDKPGIENARRRLERAGVDADAQIVEAFSADQMSDIMRSLSLLSVPAPGGEALGMFAVDALSYGVPVVLPRAGAFPEVLSLTGGGLLCEPNSVQSLADEMYRILSSDDLRQQLSREGMRGVRQHFDLQSCTVPRLLECYRQVASA